MKVNLLDSIKKIAEPIILAEGMELIDMEYQKREKNWVLCFYIDKKGGVGLEDCSLISGQIGEALEVKKLIDYPYLLEVSSPGLTRALKKEEDFIKSREKVVKIKTIQPIEGQKVFKGKLLDYKEGKVEMRVGEETIYLPFSQIAKANLVYEFPNKKKDKN